MDKVVTNGPYTVTEWLHEDKLTVEKSETYHGVSDVQLSLIHI